MYGYIYLTTNLIDGRKYIGQHKPRAYLKDKFDKSYFGSGMLIKQAIKKYGKENFHCELLEWCDSKEHLNEREIYYIELYNAVEDPVFYNIEKGGNPGHAEGYRLSEKTKKKISAKLKGKPSQLKGRQLPQEVKEKISKSKKGTTFSTEHKKALSDKLKNNTNAKRCKVKCVETGIVYPSFAEAARAMNLVSCAGIFESTKNTKRTSAGYHWEIV